MMNFKKQNKSKEKMIKGSNNQLGVMKKMSDSMDNRLINNKWNHMKINMILNKIKNFNKKINIQHAKKELIINSKIKQIKEKTS